MNAQLELSGRELMLFGAALSIVIIVLIVWIAKRYSKKKNA